MRVVPCGTHPWVDVAATNLTEHLKKPSLIVRFGSQNHNPLLLEFGRKFVPYCPSAETRGIFFFDSHENFMALTICESWTRASVHMHYAIEKPMVLRHGFLEICFSYVFNIAQRRVALGCVPANNPKALKMSKHIGFKEICRVADGHDIGVDLILHELRREDCRWLES